MESVSYNYAIVFYVKIVCNYMMTLFVLIVKFVFQNQIFTVTLKMIKIVRNVNF